MNLLLPSFLQVLQNCEIFRQCLDVYEINEVDRFVDWSDAKTSDVIKERSFWLTNNPTEKTITKWRTMITISTASRDVLGSSAIVRILTKCNKNKIIIMILAKTRVSTVQLQLDQIKHILSRFPNQYSYLSR